ncbi:MAG TPA: hypothetical protein VKJ45_06815 [Blastocatellia bacterium]|nr:hypothetical protein [Blastocatellia bacterium]
MTKVETSAPLIVTPGELPNPMPAMVSLFPFKVALAIAGAPSPNQAPFPTSILY